MPRGFVRVSRNSSDSSDYSDDSDAPIGNSKGSNDGRALAHLDTSG